MSDPARLRFLPWLRAGAAQSIATADALSGGLAANASLKPWVRLAGHDAIEQTAALRGPGHVTALGAQAIVKVEPKDGTQDFEPNYFAFAELRPADLPWRFTPAAHGERNQLRPWLVLVVIRQQDGVAIVTEPGANLPVLRIETPAIASQELPDLADSAAWVHVETALPTDTLAETLSADPDAALARLISPRRLTPNESWIACLVPAFDVGVHAGLDEDGAMQAEARPAWNLATVDAGVVRLPIYHRWSFATGPSGDFESLARRLAPDEGDTKLGRVDLDVSDPGPPLPAPPERARAIADFVGALRSPGIERGRVNAKHRAWLETELEKLVEKGAQRLTVPAAAPADYDPGRDDPVVAPPLYGSFQADRYDVPDKADAKRGWMRSLNLRPEFRAVAGLGAAVVRENQEPLLASAWSQAGELRETQRLFDQSRLAAEVGRSLARRLKAWDSGAMLQATQRLHAWVSSPATAGTLATDLQESALPTALISAGFARATRPWSAVSRAWSSQRTRPAPLQAATETLLAATSATAPASMRAALDFATTKLPVGAWTHDDALEADATLTFTSSKSPPMARARAAQQVASDIVGPISGDRFEPTLASATKLENELRHVLSAVAVIRAPARELVDLSAAASAVIAQLDPLRSLQAALVARVPAMSPLITADGALPSRLVLAPTFPDPLSLDLTRLDARYLVPGAEKLANNRIAMLEADDDFVAAFLAGANHEMSRELVWREFPASPHATFFKRFWDTGDGGPDDIGEIARWERPRLGRNLTGVTSSALAVSVMRGDVVRRYPETHVYLTRGMWEGDEVVPDASQLSEPLLQGVLDRRTIFYGFAVSAADMCGDRAGDSRSEASAGWFVTLEEASHGPRFGLDVAADDGSDLTSGAANWRALSWGHLVEPGGTLDDVDFAVAHTALPSRNAAKHGRLTWGHNAAHMAAITWQRPFRLYIHADRLVRGERA